MATKLERCESCRAPIHWITTPADKSIPVNSERLVVDPNAPATEHDTTVVQRDGRTVRGKLVPPNAQGFVGGRTHWATCPYSSQHRR